MNSHDLMTEPPRATTIVDSQTVGIARAMKKLARTIAVGFFSAAVLSGGGIAFAAAGVDTDLMIWGPVLCLTLMGAVPSLVLGSIVMRDVRTAKRLIRNAPAYRGAIVRDFCLSYKALHIVDITWNDGQQSHTARLTIPEIELTGAEAVTVLAMPTDTQIAAVFGDQGVFIGRRTE